MSFLKPTAASKSRERAVLGERGASASSTTATKAVPNFAQPLAQQLFRDAPAANSAPLPDYSHVRSRVDTGLREPRTHQSWNLTNRKRSRSPATDLASYTNRCNDVVQRAQQLLERTRRQEALVAQALQQRLSQSPVRRAPSWTSATSPGPLLAPHTTPVTAPTYTDMYARHEEEEEEEQEREAYADTPLTPARREYSAAPLMCPPPTPATGVRSPAPMPPSNDADGGDLNTASLEKPSFFQRIRNSLQRMSGQMPPDASPQPAAPAQNSPSQMAGGRSLSHARKSVHFVSPDKLEHVTPTKVQPGWEEEEESDDDVPAPVQFRSLSAAPLPAPPPSAVKAAKSNSRSRSRSTSSPRKATDTTVSPSPVPTTTAAARGRSRTASPPSRSTTSPRRSDAVARVTLSTPRSPVSPDATKTKAEAKPVKATKKATKKEKHQKATKAQKSKKSSPTPVKVTFTVPEETPSSAKKAKKTPPSPRAGSSPTTSSSRGSSAASTPEQAAKLTKVNREHHEEMLQFILNNTIKRCLGNFTKEQLVTFLHGEGVPNVKELDMTKRQLLDEIRALLGKKN